MTIYEYNYGTPNLIFRDHQQQQSCCMKQDPAKIWSSVVRTKEIIWQIPSTKPVTKRTTDDYTKKQGNFTATQSETQLFLHYTQTCGCNTDISWPLSSGQPYILISDHCHKTIKLHMIMAWCTCAC